MPSSFTTVHPPASAYSAGPPDNGTGWFADLRRSLIDSGYEQSDVYYVLGDFAAYRETKDHMTADYTDQHT